MVRTLNELSHLGQSDFNQPPPRHGLNLLYWFAENYNTLNPASKTFGFHEFHNRIDDDDDDDDKLLPRTDVQNLYYEVGNLNYPGAQMLPQYVRPNNGQYKDDHNKDRIIVRLNHNRGIDRVYVTEHSDQRSFDPKRTYRVSVGLLHLIRSMSIDEFLMRMQHSQSSYSQQSRDTSKSWCTIL